MPCCNWAKCLKWAMIPEWQLSSLVSDNLYLQIWWLCSVRNCVYFFSMFSKFWIGFFFLQSVVFMDLNARFILCSVWRKEIAASITGDQKTGIDSPHLQCKPNAEIHDILMLSSVPILDQMSSYQTTIAILLQYSSFIVHQIACAVMKLWCTINDEYCRTSWTTFLSKVA